MAKFILGRKLNMTQKFLADGRLAPVTVVEAGPCTVIQVKSDKSKDGYNAIQVGFSAKARINKPLAGHLKGLSNFRYLKEFRLDNVDNFARGKVFDVSSFSAGDNLEVTAISKGRGFQGVVKRHGFAGSPASHGHKDQLRMSGSVGATDPARVFKGTRMGGRMGSDTVTVKNLELVEVDTTNNLLYIKGAVPGSRNALVTIWSDGGQITFVEKVAAAKEPVVEKSAVSEDSQEEKVEVVENKVVEEPVTAEAKQEKNKEEK